MERDLGFDHVVTDLDELLDLCGTPDPAVRSKIVDHLDRHCRDFIARSPFFLLGTCDASGRCDVSPRGGRPASSRCPMSGSSSSATPRATS